MRFKLNLFFSFVFSSFLTLTLFFFNFQSLHSFFFIFSSLYSFFFFFQIAEKYNNEQILKNEYYQADPTGNRTGNGVGPQLSETIERVARDAEEAISKNNLTRKISTSLQILQEKLDNIRGAVIMGNIFSFLLLPFFFLSFVYCLILS